MELNPVPVLMATVVYSNIGGSITPVGDPPNVIIASNQDVIDSVRINSPTITSASFVS
jgi:Na+/H+ antiporter NhaD/arsenite permease-like protein